MKFFAALSFILLNSISSLFATPVETISPHSAFQLAQEQKAILVDVREIEEVNSGTIKNSLHLPMSQMASNRSQFIEKASKLLPKDKTIILFCRSGRRSGIVGSELQKEGYKVLNLGGFENYKQAGLK